MLGRSVNVELPRKIAVNFLLFSLTAVCWLVVGTVLVCQSAVGQRSQNEGFRRLRQAASTVAREYIRSEGQGLQPLVERLAREHGLLYCAIASKERRFIAHSRKRMVGQVCDVVADQTASHNNSPAVRRRTASGVAYEYSVPIKVHGAAIGRLVMAAAEPGLWNTLGMMAHYAPLAVFAPLLLLTLGSWTLHRMVRPIVAINLQLRRAAVTPCLSDAALQTVEGSGATAIGWNRLVDAQQGSQSAVGLGERVLEAVNKHRQNKSDDIVNSLADGVVVTDLNGQITFANSAANALLAVNTQERSLIGLAMTTCLDLDPASEFAGELLAPDLHARSLVHELTRNRGKEEEVLRIARSQIRCSDHSANAGHVWSVRDITQQKLADAMRDEFLDNATHELRTPLSNIKAYAETLTLSDELDVESQKEFCNVINTEATRLARFIDDLLSVSSMEAGSITLNKQAVDLERLFSEVVAKVQSQMDQKQISFEAIFPAKYPQLRIDKDKINVALVNLLGNAAKYTPQQGSVRFEVKVTDRELRIEVEDTGIGIAEEDQFRIFEKFFRSSNDDVQAVTGTGLGLSMAYEIIRLHGGSLAVQSVLDEGTTFTTTLPLE